LTKVTSANKQAIDGGDLLSVLKRIYDENGRQYFKAYAFVVLCLLVISATTAFSAWIMRDVIDEIFYNQRKDLIALISFAIMGAFTLRALAMYFQATTMKRIGNDLVARYQKRVFSKLMSTGVDFFTDNRSGRLAAMISANIEGIREVLSLTITSLARDFVTLVGLVIVMFLQDATLSLVTFIIGPLLIFGVAYISKRIRSVTRETVHLNARVIGTMQEAMQGITVIKAFTMEEQLSKKIEDTIEHAKNRNNKLAVISERVTPITEIIAGFAVAGAIAYGGYRAINDAQPPGAMFAFITALLFAYDPAKRLARLKVNLEKAVVNARMIYEILDMEDKQRDASGAVELAVDGGEIEFRNVDFDYGDGSYVLQGLSFKAESRKTTALVGPSGSGKSTVISLIQRFYDPASGNILIDGQNIGGVTKSSLRQQIAFVSQQAYLFEGSIMDNIRYGRPDATDAEIIQAAELANAHQFILQQAEGYDTPVGENGVTLSGGQRQRVSIARAIVRNAPILLLDEATSALDNESERLVQDALEKVMKGRTTIVVAHRLSTIINADKIIVINDGQVVETGTHESLSKKRGGMYARLNQLGKGGKAALDIE
jgi:ATP-binding cassette subfamily B protein